LILAVFGAENAAVIGNLQVLRAYAALGVATLHTGTTHGADFYGVAIFFVISGFLMCHFLHERPHIFFLKRLIRIVPLYWAATLLLVYLFGGFNWHDWRDVVLSLLFLPHMSAQGNWSPTLGVGWTLVIEMYFYVVFALGLSVAGRRAPLLVSVILLAGVILEQTFSFDSVPWRYLGNIYILQFITGFAIFYATQMSPRLPRLPWVLLPIAIIIGGLISLFRAPTVTYGLNITPDLFITFLVSTSIVLVAVLLTKSGRDTGSATALLLGNASYAIYLLHTIIIEWLRQRGFTFAEHPETVPLYLLAVTGTSCVVYVYGERPVRTLLRKAILIRPVAAKHAAVAKIRA
jgi:exopolysaccharide production protein ExoZ